jgi:hypothetical protein
VADVLSRRLGRTGTPQWQGQIQGQIVVHGTFREGFRDGSGLYVEIRTEYRMMSFFEIVRRPRFGRLATVPTTSTVHLLYCTQQSLPPFTLSPSFTFSRRPRATCYNSSTVLAHNASSILAQWRRPPIAPPHRARLPPAPLRVLCPPVLRQRRVPQGAATTTDAPIACSPAFFRKE